MIGDVATRMVSLSSLYLVVYHEDDNNTPKTQNTPRRKQGCQVLVKIPMMNSTNELQTKVEGFFHRTEINVLTVRNLGYKNGVQLMFEADTYEFGDLYNWQRCVEEARDINRCSINHLAHAKQTIAYSQSRKSKGLKKHLSRSDTQLSIH